MHASKGGGDAAQNAYNHGQSTVTEAQGCTQGSCGQKQVHRTQGTEQQHNHTVGHVTHGCHDTHRAVG